MSRCLAVETFFRSPTRGGPGAWRAPGWDMYGGPEMIGMRKMLVCEGDAPEYGEGLQATGAGPRSPSGMESGSARKGAEEE